MTGCKLFKFFTQSNSTFFSILDLLQFLKQLCCSIPLELFIFLVFGGQASYWWAFSLSSVNSEEALLKLSSIFSGSFCINLFSSSLFSSRVLDGEGGWKFVFEYVSNCSLQKLSKISLNHVFCWSKLVTVLFLLILWWSRIKWKRYVRVTGVFIFRNFLLLLNCKCSCSSTCLFNIPFNSSMQPTFLNDSSSDDIFFSKKWSNRQRCASLFVVGWWDWYSLLYDSLCLLYWLFLSFCNVHRNDNARLFSLLHSLQRVFIPPFRIIPPFKTIFNLPFPVLFSQTLNVVMLIASAKSRGARGASYQPAVMVSCLNTSHICLSSKVRNSYCVPGFTEVGSCCY